MHWHILGAVEDQLADDLLRPGGAGFGIGRNDDIVIAELEIVPDGGIDMMVMEFPRLSRPSKVIRRCRYPHDCRLPIFVCPQRSVMGEW